MISFILTSRVKGNKDSNIGRFLDSLRDCTRPENVEVILKYDTDDDQRPSDEFFKRYPFPIKVFTWSRGEGRHAIHEAHPYLFTQHDPRSRFITISADDFTFVRKGFDDDILNITDKYCFVGEVRIPVEQMVGRWLEPHIIKMWLHSGGVPYLPCLSVGMAEVMQNFGWQCNFDNTVSLLHVMVYEQFGLDVFRTVPHYYERNPTDGASGYSPTFNNMCTDGIRIASNAYYFTLLRRQARNIGLNVLFEDVQK